MVRAVLTGRSTVSGFDLSWFSALSSERLCVRSSIHDTHYIFNIFCLAYILLFTFHSELSLVRLVLELVDLPSSFSAMMLLVVPSSPK